MTLSKNHLRTRLSNDVRAFLSNKVFTPGDRVIIISSFKSKGLHVNLVGTVLRKGFGNQYWVKFDDNSEHNFKGAYLEKV
jgi:hypothetical protein